MAYGRWHIEAGCGELVSRNEPIPCFAELAAWIGEHLHVESAVLDGEIACVDDAGQASFPRVAFSEATVRVHRV